MADSRFFKNSGALSLQDIASLTGAVPATRSGKPANVAQRFTDVAPLETAGKEHVGFLDNVKYADAFAASKAGACFVRPKFVPRAPEGMTLLVTEQPYYCYALTAQRFYPESAHKPDISPQAHISKSASVGKDCRIDPGAVIGDNVKIGDGCWIGANAVIGEGVEIGKNTRIGANSTLSHAVLGNNVLIHRGVHIGQDGFGFAPGGKGITKVPQLGRVVIGDNVEIGSGTCIDRGAGPDTVIGHGSKIDNLVQIGHNVKIGQYAMIAAQTGIAGSTTIEDGALLGGQVGISGHVTIGRGAKLAAQAGIMTDVPAGATYGGFPAMPMREWHRQTVAVGKLIKKETKE